MTISSTTTTKNRAGRPAKPEHNARFLRAWAEARTFEEQAAVAKRFGYRNRGSAKARAGQIARMVAAPAVAPVELPVALAPALKSAIEALAAILVIVDQHRAQ